MSQRLEMARKTSSPAASAAENSAGCQCDICLLPTGSLPALAATGWIVGAELSFLPSEPARPEPA